MKYTMDLGTFIRLSTMCCGMAAMAYLNPNSVTLFYLDERPEDEAVDEFIDKARKYPDVKRITVEDSAERLSLKVQLATVRI